MQRTLLLFFALILWAAGFGQSPKGRSLADWLKQPDSKEKVEALGKISLDISNDSPDSCLLIGRMIVKVATDIGDSLGVAMGYRRIGVAHTRLGHPADSSLLYLRTALDMSRRLNDPAGIISCAQKISDVQIQQGKLNEAMDMLITALQISRTTGDREEEARSLNKMAILYRKLGKMEPALESAFKSLAIRKELGANTDVMLTMQTIANLYADFKRPEKAREYTLECLDIAKRMGSRSGLAWAYSSLTKQSSNEGNYESALAYADSTSELFGLMGRSVDEATSLINSAKALRELKRPDEAADRLKKATELLDPTKPVTEMARVRTVSALLAMDRDDLVTASKELVAAIELTKGDANTTIERMSAMKTLAEVRQKQGRLDEALDLMHQYQALREERLNEKGTEQLAESEMREKYEADLRIKEIEELKARNAMEVAQKERRTLQLYAAVLLVVVLAVLASVLLRNMQHIKRLRAQEQSLHEQRVNDLLKQQEIRSLDAMMQGQERERERIAKDLHDRLGSMLSAIKLQFSALEGRIAEMESQHKEQYQHVFNLLDDAVTEVRRISHDMVRGTLAQFGLERALEDLRSTIAVPGKLKVELSVFGLGDRLENKLEIALYRMVQEMVSNALKHARADQLTVQVTRSAGIVNLIVEDNGKGFDPTTAKEGMGLGNIRARAAEFKGVVNVDSKPGRGTSISIDIPLS